MNYDCDMNVTGQWIKENLSGECDLEGVGERVLEQSDSDDDSDCEHIEM